jgi:hypothetical protein
MATEDLGTQAPPAGNGHSAGQEGPRPAPLMPPRAKVSMKPAMVVLALAVFILGLFGALSLISTGGPAPTTPLPAAVHVPGTTLSAVPATGTLRPIEHPDTPPKNVLDALSLPAGFTAHGYADNSTSAGQYDEQMRFSLATSETTVVDFYRYELTHKGWTIESVGAATDLKGGVEVLAQKAGDDGYYWEAGAVVSPTTFAVAQGPKAETTAFTLRLFEVPDEE